jgi:tRNA acetyltransferase TAN1
LSTKDVINLLAAAVPKGHKVDLENPDYTIIVEVCQVKKKVMMIDARK